MKEVIGHGDYQYRVNRNWSKADAVKYPVNDCHEMVRAQNGLLYMLTNEVKNNILVYSKDGNIVSVWGNEFPGGHGLTIADENGTEYLYITDTVRHEVIKTSLDGKIISVYSYPKEIPEYTAVNEYKPTETAVAANGDLYVTDGYGHQFVIQYDHAGNYIRHWGGKGDGREQFDCAHGITVDSRYSEPSLLITSRNHQALKRFTLDGQYIETISLPGSFICRPVIHGKNVYGAVFRSEHNQNFGSGYVTILDEHHRVISSPGGTEPIYADGVLQPQKQVGQTFIHPHDVCVDADENLLIPQWNAGKTYPVFLERV
ncbi:MULTISPECIES: 6-bladed beta-propeller [unclassified Mucilaginibacter]|uniref:6-bladed beta-propeller n=1 Tax=unclassified Mucilaginibacter TaxID=2617802 RepID=UPI0031F603A7